jgi:hypothetical protein
MVRLLGQQPRDSRRVWKTFLIAARGEPLPGGACTHWKAPPFHGARQFRTQHRSKISFDYFVGLGEPMRLQRFNFSEQARHIHRFGVEVIATSSESLFLIASHGIRR